MQHNLWIIAGIAALYLPLLVSPGLNFVLITQSAASRTRAHSVSIALGVCTGSMVWACMAAAGLGVLLVRFESLRLAIYGVGGLYLLLTAWRLWPRGPAPVVSVSHAVAPERVASAPGQLARAYWHGLATNMTNPKPLVFYTTVFAGLFTPSLATWVKYACIGTIFTLSLGWHLLLATAFSNASVQRHYARAGAWISRVTSGMMLAFGLQLLHNLVVVA